MNNKYKKIAKKVGKGNYGHYGHPTAIVGERKVLGRVGVMGFVFVAMFAAAGVTMPASAGRPFLPCQTRLRTAKEAAFSYDK